MSNEYTKVLTGRFEFRKNIMDQQVLYVEKEDYFPSSYPPRKIVSKATSDDIEKLFPRKNINSFTDRNLLELVKTELETMYKRLGYKGSNVLHAVSQKLEGNG